MIKFEYLVLEGELKAEGFDDYGKKGWELVSVIHYSKRVPAGIEHIYKYYFKRIYEEKKQCEEHKKTQEKESEKEVSDDNQTERDMQKSETREEEKK